MLHEQPHLLPLAVEPFEVSETSYPMVDGLRCVRVRTNRYSTPLPPGTRVEARVRADYVEVWHEGVAGRDMNAATAGNSRSSIWNTISTCCGRSRVHWRVRRRWRSGGRPGAGPSASTTYGKR